MSDISVQSFETSVVNQNFQKIQIEMNCSTCNAYVYENKQKTWKYYFSNYFSSELNASHIW